tara:strand:- start:252 stop:1214 length:963 start_codon:yes stop_codon:yes gene_type:complete
MPRINIFPYGDFLLEKRDISSPTDTYNKNVHTHWSDRGSGSGIYSTVNGELGLANLDPDFTLTRNEIMPEQAALARVQHIRKTNTIYGRNAGNLREKNTYGASDQGDFFNVPGLSLRWYQPYQATAGIAQWSFFLSYNNWMGRFRDMLGSNWAQGVFTEINLRCVLDGNVLQGTNRRLGENFFHPVSPGGPNPFKHYDGPGLLSYDLPESTDYTELAKETASGNPKYCFPEAHSATHFDMHYLMDSSELTQGYHEISVQCAIRACKDVDGQKPAPVFLQNVGGEIIIKDTKSKRYKQRGHFNLTAKVSFGMRNARVVSFL